MQKDRDLDMIPDPDMAQVHRTAEHSERQQLYRRVVAATIPFSSSLTSGDPVQDVRVPVTN
jgi:hypothetical protein